MNIDGYTDAMIVRAKSIKPNLIVEKFHNREKSLFKDFPSNGIDIELKPKNSGRFVIWMMKFPFFNYPLLENYLKHKLNSEVAHFALTSQCIYIYPKNKNDLNEDFKALEFCCGVIVKTINEIEKTITI